MGNYRQDEAGYTLIIVIWILVILSIILLNLVDEITLDNLLLSYQQQEKLARQTALSGIAAGIAKLQEDDTLADSYRDDWARQLTGSLNSLDYLVEIADVGSRINLNYDQEELLTTLTWWNEQLSLVTRETIIPHLLLIRGLLGEDYQKAQNTVSTLGKFNINRDSLTSLGKLLLYLEIEPEQIKVISNGLQELRSEHTNLYLDSLDQLPFRIEGLDLIVYQQLKPYLTVEGRVNINLVPLELLRIILKGFDLSSGLADRIDAYRQENEITGVEQLSGILTEEEMAQIRGYFTTASRYFIISSRAISAQEKAEAELYTLVERTRNEAGEWQIKVLEWQEL